MKKTLKIALVLALALVMVFTLTACQHDCAKDGHEYVDGVCKHCGEEESAGGGGEIPAGLPVAEGKVVMYLTLTDIELASRNSIFLCGPMNYTEASTDFGATAAEMSRLGETNVYYVVYTAEQITAGLAEGIVNSGEYQLVLGWNASSGVPASSQGVNWSFKFDQETTGTANPSWAELYTAGAQAINLGDVKFSCGQPGAPVQLSKVTLSVTLSEALPEGWELVMPGSHIVWDKQEASDATDTEPAKQSTILTPNADRTVWSLEIKDIYAGEYEYKLIANKVGAGLAWANVAEGFTEDNQKIEISGADENSVVPLYGSAISYPDSIFSAPVVTNGTIKVTFATALEAGLKVGIAGGFNGDSWPFVEMTANADRTEFTLTLTVDIEDGTQFKVGVYSSDTTEMGWSNPLALYGLDGAQGLTDIGNAKLAIATGGDGLTIDAFAEALVYPVVADAE